jgi:hypothetical protein
MRRAILPIVVLCVAAAGAAQQREGRPSESTTSLLQGVWQLEPSAAGRAGVYIFTRTHYSMMAAATDRPDIVDSSKATADELRALWNPMLGNAGAYDVTGNLVTIHPVVAKFPAVMKPGAYEVYEFHVDGNTLSLTQRRNTRGPVENGGTTTLVRVE